MLVLTRSSKPNLSVHVKRNFEDGEVLESADVKKCSITALEGKVYQVSHDLLDAVLAVGYRVRCRLRPTAPR